MQSDRYSRQSFLGSDSESQIQSCVAGVIGAGGGGSHINQQLAHLGFCNFEIYDPDHVEHSNLNRMVGSTVQDADDKVLKVVVAERLIKGLHPKAKVVTHDKRWQEDPDGLRSCQVIFGCVDGYSERNELEIFCRRNLIPLIDIGLDVHAIGDEPPQMAGQIILSMPGFPCMRCYGFLTDEKLAQEAAKYGDAGVRPQVVWANGVLASTAVGLAVDLITDWSRKLRNSVYLQYYANRYTVQPHPRAQNMEGMTCTHYPPSQAGDPMIRTL